MSVMQASDLDTADLPWWRTSNWWNGLLSWNDGKDTKSKKPKSDPLELDRMLKKDEDLVSPLTEDEETDLRMRSVEERWKLLFNEKTREPVYPWKHYIDQLKQYVNQRSKAMTSRKKDSSNHGNHLMILLRQLKLDLKMSYESFVKDFVRAGGLELLVAVLRDVQHGQAEVNTISRKKAKHHELYKQNLAEEFDCLLCIKFATRSDQHISQLLKCKNAAETIAICQMSSFVRTRVIALEMMIYFCELTEGYQQVLDAMTMMRIRFAESVRFKMLVGMLNSQGNNQIRLQAMCVRFFNKLLSATDNENAKVYLQHELHLAGFDPDILDKHVGDGIEYNDLYRELEIWRENYISVHNTNQNIHSLENRNALLRQEVDILQDKIKEFEKEKENEVKKIDKLNEKCEEYRERAAELQDTVEKLQRLYKQKTGQDLEKQVSLGEVMAPLDLPPQTKTLADDKFGTISSVKSVASSVDDFPECPPAPPPVPVPPPFFLSSTVRKKVVPRVNLPFLNWTPLKNVRNTIFQDIDDEVYLRDIDFSKFEDKFKLPIRTESRETKEKREKFFRQEAVKIHFIDNNRAKNMIITKRRTMLSSREIREYIDHCDIEKFSGEYAELLIKFIPDKNELKLLAQNALNYKDMGEAEQFLFQLAQIERLQSKLSVMAFIGFFKELVSSLKPKIQNICRASVSVIQCKKLKSLLEIILAFGNYMNSSKRGYTLGFKIQSFCKLKDVRSTDKSITLLHFLADLIATHYPHLLDFYTDLELHIDRGVSYQAVAADVHGLRKGLDLVKYEREKQQTNQILETFYQEASGEVAIIAESFHRMEEAYQEVCLLYSENYKNIEPDEFFKTFADFVSDFKKAVQENESRRKREISKQRAMIGQKKSMGDLTEELKRRFQENEHAPRPGSLLNARSSSESSLLEPSSNDKAYKPHHANITQMSARDKYMQSFANEMNTLAQSNPSQSNNRTPVYEDVYTENITNNKLSVSAKEEEEKYAQQRKANLKYRNSGRNNKQDKIYEPRRYEEIRQNKVENDHIEEVNSNWVLRSHSNSIDEAYDSSMDKGSDHDGWNSPNYNRSRNNKNYDDTNIYDSIPDLNASSVPSNNQRVRQDSDSMRINQALGELDKVLDENSGKMDDLYTTYM